MSSSSDQSRDVFGLGGLLNPSYASPQAAEIEKQHLMGAKSATSEGSHEVPHESMQELLKQRFEEIAKRTGVNLAPAGETVLEDLDEAALAEPAHAQQPPSYPSMMQPSTSSQSQVSMIPSSASGSDYPFTLSTEGLQHTEESRKRERLASALGMIAPGSEGFLDEDREHDRKLSAIEEIKDLVQTFKEDDEDVSDIRIPTHEDQLETILSILKLLRKHNDRKRFGTLADDCILLAATSLETLCDGNREWLGFRPDLTGWSNQVRGKLRRMRHDTSQIASSILNDYNIGPGLRLVIELIPNMVMYARGSHSRAGDEKAPSGKRDHDFDASLRHLGDV